MNVEEFQARGHELVDWVAGYLASLDEVSVGPGVAPGWVGAQLPPSPPSAPEAWADVVADLERVIVPALTDWQSPRFFAYFPGNTSPAAVLAELVIAGFGQQGMLWASSPASTELETRVCDWLAEALGLPARLRSDGPGGGAIQDAASTATFVALVAARHAATGGDPALLASLRAYTSADAHSSVEKGLRLAGLAADQLRLVAVDSERAMRVDALRAAVEADAAAGLRPFALVTTIGTTSFMAIDPVAEASAIAAEHGLWHHVDAAMAGSAGVAPELRPLVTAGLDTADSYCFDPHKWLLAGMDCDVLYVADRARLLDAMAVVPEYLRNAATESGSVTDYRDWGVALGRRFRSLKPWFVLRTYGTDALADMVRRHCALASWLAAQVVEHPALDLVVPCRLNLVCLAHRDGDEATQRLIDAVNASGALVTHTRLDGRLVLRVCVGTERVEARHVEGLWDVLEAAIA